MPRSRYKFFESEYPYFMTCTINSWLPIFTRQEAADIILDSWRFLQKERGFKLFAYVILENHIHLIASAPDISGVMQSFKSYTARQIVDLLKSRGSETLLRQLSATKLNHKTDSTYQIWQEGSHPQQIQGDDMMWQKIEYIHNNPVLRGFVDDPLHWRWSSARNYARQKGLIEVMTDWQ